ncbi:ATP synthase mitochondrial F1 complex assembly factor 2 [Anopheles marshallii]|uniref:ATP synthase mitochondrial F1 complex assembly factor 2 n=1 Tax=Anopheles marshallii TaxID=1521116 RepID=UPI00237B3024|nr:ATP synthase mitochondrial F1 complex assembly factor 2 [Anopheles marshallii]
MLRSCVSNIARIQRSSFQISIRHYAAPPKRFYKNTGVVSSNGRYEITLDTRKLKTPRGLPFYVESEPLAIAIATEWDAQKEVIDRSSMHLTALSSTVIDNPNSLQKHDMVNYLVNYINTDTVLFHSSEEPELKNIQNQEWTPIVEWCNKRYEINLASTDSLVVPTFEPGMAMNLSRYFSSYNSAALHGFVFAVDTIKSIILTMACVDRYIPIEKAVRLARLEEEFQQGHWGKVEWAHDVQRLDSQARLSAAVLYIYFNTSNVFVKEKISL